MSFVLFYKMSKANEKVLCDTPYDSYSDLSDEFVFDSDDDLDFIINRLFGSTRT